jgi:hypothetical protein
MNYRQELTVYLLQFIVFLLIKIPLVIFKNSILIRKIYIFLIKQISMEEVHFYLSSLEKDA